MRYDQRPAFEAVGWVWPTEKTDFLWSPICSCPDNSFLQATLHFSPHALFCGCANITFHLVHIPHLLPEEMGGKKWRRKGRHKSRSALSPISGTKWVICECSWIIYYNGKLVRKRFGYCLKELWMWRDGAGKNYNESLVLLFLWFLFFFFFSFHKWNHFFVWAK